MSAREGAVSLSAQEGPHVHAVSPSRCEHPARLEETGCLKGVCCMNGCPCSCKWVACEVVVCVSLITVLLQRGNTDIVSSGSGHELNMQTGRDPAGNMQQCTRQRCAVAATDGACVYSGMQTENIVNCRSSKSKRASDSVYVLLLLADHQSLLEACSGLLHLHQLTDQPTRTSKQHHPS